MDVRSAARDNVKARVQELLGKMSLEEKAKGGDVIAAKIVS